MLKRGTDRSEGLNCGQVNALLGSYLEGGLPPEQADAVAAHLDACLDCRRAASLDAEVASRLRLEAAWQRRRLSPRAAARIQQRLYGRMRRSMMAQRAGRFAWGAVGLTALALILFGGYAWWQQRPVGRDATPAITGTPVLATQTANPRPTVGPTNTSIPPTVMPGTGSEVIITFACSKSDLGHYEELAEAFHVENPTIQVEVVDSDGVVDDGEDAFRALAASADSFALKRTLVPSDLRSGLIRDLQPFVDADGTFDADDFYLGLLDGYRWQGGLWALPSPGTPLLIFFDKAAFEEAGLPYPEPGWSYEEFETAAEALTEERGNADIRYGLVLLPHSYAARILIAGRALESAGGAGVPSEAALDTPAMAEAMQWLLDLDAVRGAMPSLLEVTDGSQHFVAELVEDRRAAMWDGWPTFSSMRIYQAVYDDLGVVPFPEGTAVADWMGGAPYVMSAGTTHPDEVWRWLRFLTYQPGDVQAVEPPVRRSVAAASGYWAELDPDLSAAVRYVAERPKVALPLGMLSAISNALTGALTEGGDVNAALAGAQAGLSRALGAPVSQTPPPPVPTPVPTAATGVTVEFAAATDHYMLERAYDRLAAEFHMLYPEITVKPKPPNYGTGYQAVTYEWLASEADCFAYYFSPMADEAETPVLTLDPLLDGDPAFPVDDFYPHLLERFYQEGKLWALPKEVSPRVMYYNKALFDRAGLAYPAPGWTLNDFAEAAARLTEGEGQEKQYGYSPDTFFLPGDALFFLMQRGIPHPEGGAGVSWDDPDIAEAVRWYVGLWEAGIMPEYEVSGPGEGDSETWTRDKRLWESLIRDGRVAMWSTHRGAYESYSRVWSNLDVGIAPMPQGPGRVVDVMPVGYYISAESEHPEACWQWLNFLSGQVGIRVGAPTRRSVLNSVEYRQHAGAEVADVYLAALEGSERVIDTNSIYWNTYEGRIVQAVILGLQGEDVEQALRQVQDQGEE